MITTSADWSEVKFNGTDIAQVNFNGVKVWEKGPAQGIYGVKSQKSAWTTSDGHILVRTDDAANFTATAYVNDGNTPGSSSFDGIMPWAGMTVETIGTDDKFVKIPKFWYQIYEDNSYLYVRIANYAAEGFTVSPAHRARDGHGELDEIYIGRYLTGSTTSPYKISQTGVNPKTNTKSTWRTQIRRRFNGNVDTLTPYSLEDISMVMTIRLLYLVEYADWDSRLVIGKTTALTTSDLNGQTDSMGYHTGTLASERTTAAITQYRNIENCLVNNQVIDGVIFTSGTAYVFDSMSAYGETTTSSTSVGAVSTGDNYVSNPGTRDWPTPASATGITTKGGLMLPSAVATGSTNLGCYWAYRISGTQIGNMNTVSKGIMSSDIENNASSYNRFARTVYTPTQS